NIQSVSVRIDDVTVTEVIVEDSTTIHLKCSESPERIWLGTYSSITYTWLRNSSPLSETGETLPLTTSGTYSCSVKLDSKVAVTSNTVQVTVSSTPLVTTTATNPVKGSRVILTCGPKRGDGVVYTWSKDSVVIYRQFDRKLHLDNVDTADSGTYSCSAFHSGLFYSGSITFNVQETSTAECGLDKNCTKIGFVCDNIVCKCASGHFQDDGSCVAIDAKTNTTICASDKDCTLTGFKCNNKLCVCASGNLPINGECSAMEKNGVVQVVSSMVLIMLTCVILKFI
uniref:Ig-like domain-containing protein n=1 Tax=Biomphalaria glabrata TaxID=6526 RepID=A0A2C9KGQ5_BIOGL